MADFVLSCCSTADLTKEHFQQRDISYICFHYQLDGVDYPDDLGESMPFDKFYAAMANGADTRTSQVNISEFVDYFTPFLEQGKDILHVCLSSGLSGVSNSAENAARIVRERYPERKIYIVDSLGASSGYGLLMDKLADLRDEGMGIDAVRDWAEAHKLELHHWFFSTDLTFYVRGGRISKVAGVLCIVWQISVCLIGIIPVTAPSFLTQHGCERMLFDTSIIRRSSRIEMSSPGTTVEN